MSGAAWLQLVALLVLLAISTPLLGSYMAKVYGGGQAPGDRVFGPVERLIYRICGVDENTEQRWTTYALSLLAFSFASVVVLYAQLRLQGHLPFNPDHQKDVGPLLSFNTAVSFLTNTNWQNYSGESTMSHLSQMAGLAVHNFVSAAAGAAVAVALIRGFVRRRTHTFGNFWVDLVRTTIRVLLPLAIVFTLVLVSQGAVQNFHQARTVTTVTGQTQTIPGGPMASQEAIKEIGENGGGFTNANSSHPFENPNGITEHPRDLDAARDPVRPHVDVREDGRRREAGHRVAERDARALARDITGRDGVRGQGEPEAHRARRESTHHRRAVRREHGRQGSSLRYRSVGAVRFLDHRHLDRFDRLATRQLHADRRGGTPREHHAR